MLTKALAALSKSYDNSEQGDRGDPGGPGDPSDSAHAPTPQRYRLPVFGETIEVPDYTRAENWLNLPGVIEAPRLPSLAAEPSPDFDVDVFFAYPTAWRARGAYPLAGLDNEEMRLGALYSLQTRASAFGTVGRVFAPYYRQIDAAYVSTMQPTQAAELFYGAPLADVSAAFSCYLEHYNKGRPFILVGHSQGSIVLAGLLVTALAPEASSAAPLAPAPPAATAPAAPLAPVAPLARMIAAYLIGSTWTPAAYEAAPFLKPAQRADDTGVIISYNTEAPMVDGLNPFSKPGAVTINPISWRTDDTLAPASLSKGGIIVGAEGSVERREHLADARINPQRGTIICSTVDRERFSSTQASRAYFPLGVLHTSDITLYYYDLRANAELRTRAFMSAR
jgi:hypothetical protein